MIERIRGRTETRVTGPEALSPDNLPQHVAIIMDGNGRWARERGLPRAAGHRSGMQAVKRAVRAANRLGIRYLTLYAFSTENWKRPKAEVDFLMRLPQEFLAIELDELIANNVQVRMIGQREGLPAHTLEAIDEAIRRTAGNCGLVLNFALNYGSRKELLEAARALARDAAEGRIDPDAITEADIEARLQTSGMPEPDLLIRTSGELRISNFMMWQLAYSELWFTDVYWPEFTEAHFYEAVGEYQRRTRRYGGLKDGGE